MYCFLREWIYALVEQSNNYLNTTEITLTLFQGVLFQKFEGESMFPDPPRLVTYTKVCMLFLYLYSGTSLIQTSLIQAPPLSGQPKLVMWLVVY